MTSHTPFFRVFAAAAALFVAGLVSVPTPAQAVSVSLSADRSSAPPTVLVKFTGGSAAFAGGTGVQLQRRTGSGPWMPVATGTLNSSKQFSISVRAATGTHKYRAFINETSFSPELTVAGMYGRNISVPAPGAPFTLSGQLPVGLPPVDSRPVYVLWYTSGTWKQRGGSASSSSGFVGVRTNLPSTSPVRLYAPPQGALPAWYGPMGKITIGSDSRISRILADTNKYRASKGKPALKLYYPLNTVAGNWAYYMQQNCDFRHNTTADGKLNVSGYPSGWKAAAENIAVGQTYTTVVAAWINSPGHRANILGNYTHIGIGYYEGSNCSANRYWVQNFARY